MRALNTTMAGNFAKKEHAFKTFNNDLKADKFPAVLLLYGCEDYLVDWAANSLVKRFVNQGALSLDYVKLGDDGQGADGLRHGGQHFRNPKQIEKRRYILQRQHIHAGGAGDIRIIGYNAACQAEVDPVLAVQGMADGAVNFRAELLQPGLYARHGTGKNGIHAFAAQHVIQAGDVIHAGGFAARVIP